ncbi:YceD family protein [Pyrinomonas methylaliphatogenes]|uniref:Predicted metal-binding protein, possibly nucleic-acid binding n=1 Tax=Pyrinomonas methylaliphatogenes TaxID=454194 RepID=A0A0B6X0N1_9BACT|nr:DUF177 domain-containing protein [Pyrinomonas methylaliphatogenes]MBX5478598.1 DUF177 domain-containing protein [Pyrinomonas methylaliphatogenes]CDM66079.1 predicted metal-binding protein, possibly nucleic-acid binding [Pyrinomonas methylaliphatogenes]
MRFEVERLTIEGTSFRQDYAPEALSFEAERIRLIAPATVHGRIWRKGREVLLQGRLTARVAALCDRCLREFETLVETEIDVSYVPEEDDATAEDLELSADEMAQSVFSGGEVDLDELVREQFLLALPMRRLCREECRGLCPRCGADLNLGDCQCEAAEIDPRWAALAAWKRKKEADGE